MLFGKISINCHIGVQDICNYLEALASERKSGCQLTIQATNTRLLSNTTKGCEGKTLSHLFLSFTTLLPSSFIHRIIESTENFREKQRKTEKFREIQRNSETGFQKLIACRGSLCNFASTNQNNLKLCTKLKSLKILISVRFARQLERMAHLSSVPLMFAEH